jgi:UDP-N-acetylmuramyl pentapeptide phosphotransferase/UDP-N-acetylglucosamine-1-phosphate transferase
MRDIIYILASYLIALIVSARSIPTVIKVSHQLRLFSETNGRSATSHRIPTLGGIAIFAGFILGLTLTHEGYVLPGLSYIIAGILIMFFVGLKDDIVSLSATKKILAEICVAAIFIFLGDFRFTHLHGFLGIGNISFIPSALITGFLMIVFINAFNLIDGIDGLAAGIGMYAAIVFGVWFYLSGHFEFTIVSFSLVGALSGFFFYNMYGKKNKLFMGDNGSLVLGTIISLLVIQFNEFNIDTKGPHAILSAPAVSFGILCYPLMDTLRVFAIRIIQKKSPFVADKNHTHHRLLVLGMSHKRASYLIITINALFTLSVIYFQYLGIMWLMLFNTVTGGILLLIPSYLVASRKLIKEDDPYQEIIFFGSPVFKNSKKKEIEKISRTIPLNRIKEKVQRIGLW